MIQRPVSRPAQLAKYFANPCLQPAYANKDGICEAMNALKLRVSIGWLDFSSFYKSPLALGKIPVKDGARSVNGSQCLILSENV